jgi:CRP-like cAMP-binding protein
MAPESVLAAVPLFDGLDPAALDGLEAFCFRSSFAPGELVVEQGRTGNGLYVVLSGKVEVFKSTGTDHHQVLTTLGPGEPFGEMALLGEWPRTASVRALEPTECLGMDRWVFLAHLEKEPQLAIRMLQILAQRLADTNDRLAE